MLRNIGELFSKIVMLQIGELESCADIKAYRAPCECFDLVRKSYAKEREELDRWFIENYHITTKEVIEEAEERTGICEYTLMDMCVGRLYTNPYA